MPLPTGEPDSIARWACAPPLRALVRAFGAELPASAPVEDLLRWLDDFSAEHWDFRARAGRVERDQVGDVALPTRTTDVVLRAAAALGMLTPSVPPRRRYRHLLILGGLAASCLRRSAYAAALVGGGTVEVESVAALGSLRPLGEHERRDGWAVEVDALAAGVRAGFGPRLDPDVAPRWSPGRAAPLVRVLAAPSTGARRADTADTYRYWAEQGDLHPDDRVLVVTSAPYVPFQHCDALRILGCAVDTVGEAPPQPLGPHRYLQEVRSAIRAMRALLAAARDGASASSAHRGATPARCAGSAGAGGLDRLAEHP